MKLNDRVNISRDGGTTWESYYVAESRLFHYMLRPFGQTEPQYSLEIKRIEFTKYEKGENAVVTFDGMTALMKKP